MYNVIYNELMQLWQFSEDSHNTVIVMIACATKIGEFCLWFDKWCSYILAKELQGYTRNIQVFDRYQQREKSVGAKILWKNRPSDEFPKW